MHLLYSAFKFLRCRAGPDHGGTVSETQPSGSGSKVEIIQALRGIAALGVVLWHTALFLGPYGEGIGATLFLSASTMGVDLFFIICGFVMVISSTRPDGRVIPARDFFIRRLSRIYPLYCLATVALFAMEYHGPLQTGSRLANSLLLIPTSGSGLPAITAPTLIVGWTILYELGFYCAFGLSLLLGRRYWFGIAAWAIAVLLLPALLAGNNPFDPYSGIETLPAVLQILINPINWLFATGMLIAALFRSRVTLTRPGMAKSLCALSAILAIAQYATQFRVQHGIFNAGLTLIPLVMVLTLATKTIVLHPLKPVAYLGRISFSLYMLHPSAIWVYIYTKNMFGIVNPLAGWFAVASVTALSLVMAAVSYRYIECGLSEAIRHRISHWAAERFGVRRRDETVVAGLRPNERAAARA